MRVVDLFCGTGGFSLGAQQAGFQVAASVDVDQVLTSSYKHNFPNGRLLLADIASLSGSDLKSFAGQRIDGIIGGPPCQGFSSIGKRDAADPRSRLVEHFFRIVAEVRPSFFVMENVVGLTQGNAASVLEAGIGRLPDSYDIVGPQILHSADFGLPTSRRRCFVIGFLREHCDPPLQGICKCSQSVTVRDAIQDLMSIRPLGLDNEGFDTFEIVDDSPPSAYAADLRAEGNLSTGNLRTAHSPKVQTRFAGIEPGRTDPVGRHQRLSWDGLCPTLRAGTGSDRGSYQSVRPLHPEQPRVITVREAARLQGFPDRHRFHRTIWHSFRMIGNSVPPPMAAAVLRSIGQATFNQGSSSVAAE
ncbi:DNA cytosine methyltransferase [Roseovarius sp. SCSIO 43702]|uniref:DNA cytosine methyltransferase n=1 Tax=Roseovarius sp. SCSIO 43702 TaxID=2823043 RepID=UPI001C7380AE|nr:DNA cytosine methyltransferase [Roseovarius sp. SCSIO 43702]